MQDTKKWRFHEWFKDSLVESIREGIQFRDCGYYLVLSPTPVSLTQRCVTLGGFRALACCRTIPRPAVHLRRRHDSQQLRRTWRGLLSRSRLLASTACKCELLRFL